MDVLNVPKVGLDDHFFELGGHSLLAAQVLARIKDQLGLVLPLRSLFEQPALGDLAAELARLQGGDTDDDCGNMAVRIAKRFVSLPLEQRRQFLAKLREDGKDFSLLPVVESRHDFASIPLSFAQQRLLFLWQLEPHSAAYNMAAGLRLNGRLDVAALQRSFDFLATRHEALRTVFQVEGEQPRQVILDHLAVPLEQVDLTAIATDQREAELATRVREASHQPFDLLHGPLLRATLWLEAGEGARQLDYWREQLGDEQPLLEVAADYPRPLAQSFDGQTLGFDFGVELSRRLGGYARAQGMTLFMLQLVDALVPERNLGHNPLFQVKFNQNVGMQRQRSLALPGLSVAEYSLDKVGTHFDLALDITDDGQLIHGEMTFASDLYQRSTVEAFIPAFIELLGQLLDAPQLPLHRLAAPLRSEQAPQREVPALVLEQWQQQGVVSGQPVAVLMERSLDWLTCMLGILKAGAVYMPLDTKAPEARLRQMLDAAQAKVLLCAADDARLTSLAAADRLTLAYALGFDPDAFARYMAEHQVGVLKIVPGHLAALLQAGNPVDVLPRHALIVGGEACTPALVEQVRRLKPGCRLINHYGPSETTVGVLTHEVAALAEGARAVPVGEPLRGAHVLLLDDVLNPVADQVAGELYIGGASVAQGARLSRRAGRGGAGAAGAGRGRRSGGPGAAGGRRRKPSATGRLVRGAGAAG
ncbi:hypothetical protein WR25_07009 [Diploscapter pachys]|uniref:Carrier domain-containing protein n=1 Tax=Diploscapter pachys TaxID=2018661 RepID=A0A2A2KAB3_9BILA|nr:hypothetical protein WR25_07009 [Diploscapter pachys]